MGGRQALRGQQSQENNEPPTSINLLEEYGIHKRNTDNYTQSPVIKHKSLAADFHDDKTMP